MTANGGTDPYPIPWLDQKRQPQSACGTESGALRTFTTSRVWSPGCSTFTGMGTDNLGNRIGFGSPTTDYGLMQGEYWAARTPQHGAFTHI